MRHDDLAELLATVFSDRMRLFHLSARHLAVLLMIEIDLPTPSAALTVPSLADVLGHFSPATVVHALAVNQRALLLVLDLDCGFLGRLLVPLSAVSVMVLLRGVRLEDLRGSPEMLPVYAAYVPAELLEGGWSRPRVEQIQGGNGQEGGDDEE